MSAATRPACSPTSNSEPSFQYSARFRAVIAAQTGLFFDDAKLEFLGEILRRRLARHGCTGARYLDRLEEGVWRDELAVLAPELTVGETYFFRHNDQFRALTDVVLPERTKARANSKCLRLLSAGCATGEEPYSLAIAAREAIVDPSWAIAIRAIDLNPTALEKAVLARYSAWALREAPPDVQRKWFRQESRHLALADAVRSAVEFSLGNLASDDAVLWQPEVYDVIFCRNVLMYFAPEQMRAAIARMTAALAPGGYLFLGHAETLRGISEDFTLCHTHEAFYYRRKEKIAAAAPAAAMARVMPPGPIPSNSSAPPSIASSTGWVDAIRQASERVAALVSPTKSAPSSDQAHVKNGERPGWDLKVALDLLRQERFGEALDYVHSAPPEVEAAPDVLLVKAMLLAHNRQIAEAEAACRQLLAIDERGAGAHYVLALCCEHRGQRERAMEHDRFAAHLDPSFAMPRLHCGLLLRQTGDRDGVHRELQQALTLLKSEDASRLVLFGGGFTRDALIGLCELVLAGNRGHP